MKLMFFIIKASDNVRSQTITAVQSESFLEMILNHLKNKMLWSEARDVWCINLDPIFGDFFGTRAVGKELPVPFLDAFPLTVWVCIFKYLEVTILLFIIYTLIF